MATLPSLSELTTRIVRCIGIWETNRGGNAPKPNESTLDTVCGVRASMATIEQATMPYAVDALKQFSSLRSKASPALTKKELDDAAACCADVVTLLNLVTKSSLEPADFVKKRTKEIARSNLSAADVEIMFAAAELRRKIVEANAAFEAGTKTLVAAVASIPPSERLGLGAASMKSYVRKPVNWGENRAAWQRKAVGAMSGRIADRIRTVAESDDGTAFARPVVESRVKKELAKKPVPDLEAIVSRVGRQNNPGEAGYGQSIWTTYQRIFK